MFSYSIRYKKKTFYYLYLIHSLLHLSSASLSSHYDRMIQLCKRWFSITTIIKAKNTKAATTAVGVKDITAIVKNNKDLIGKGSNFTKKIINQQLVLINSTKFKRSKILNSQYDSLKATNYHNLKTDILKDKQFALLLDQNFINRIIPFLFKLTPNYRSLPNDSILPLNDSWSRQDKNSNRALSISSSFKTSLLLEVPQLPNFQLNPNKFASYIRTLTHHTIIKDQNLPHLLRTLANPMNNMTTPLQTIDTYNDILFYFKNHWDFASMREIFKFINLHPFIRPNLTTFNILISSLLKNNQIRMSKDIIIGLKFYLKLMIRQEVEIDSKTWELIMRFLTTSIGRLQFVQIMKQNNVPVTDWSSIYIMKDFPKEMINHYITKSATSKNMRRNVRITNIIIKSCLQNGEFNMALDFIRSNRSNCSVNDQTLNLFLVPLSNMGKLDHCLMIYKWFNENLGVCGDLTSFNLLLKSHVRNGYSKNFPVIYEWINLLFKDRVGLKYLPNSYWKLKCQSIVKFNYADPCYDHHNHGAPSKIKLKRLNKMDRLYEAFNLDSILFDGCQFHELQLWNVTKTHPDIRKMLRFLNVVKGCSKSGDNNKKRSKFIISNSETKIRKQKFLQRIKKIAITHSSYKKLSYSKNWYKALNDEFSKPR